MDEHLHRRHREELRPLVQQRGQLAGALFVAGMGIAGALEYHYHPERTGSLVLFFALEAATCWLAVALARRFPRLAAGLHVITCIAVLLCVTLYVTTTGAGVETLAFTALLFALATPLIFPWGIRNQAIVSGACLILYAFASAGGAAYTIGGSLPPAYGLYAVTVGVVLSVLGAGVLERQRFIVFAQREQLDRHLRTFAEFAGSFQGRDAQRVLQLACTSALRAFRLSRLWAVWRAPGSGPLQGYSVERREDDITWEVLDRPECWWAAATGRRERVRARVARGTDVPEPATQQPGPTVLAVPLSFEGELLGAIFADRGAEPFTLAERELELATILGNGAAVALANAHLYQRLAAASEEKSTALARIAHELRNPLHTILWDVDALREDAAGDAAVTERLRRNALLTLELAKDLQAFSEIETRRLAAHPEPVRLANVFDDVVASARGLLQGRSVLLRTVVAPDAETLVTDPLRLRQILGNLLSNAAKFTARGSITLESRRMADEVALCVHDTGMGIAPAELGEIFTPFFRGSARTTDSVRGMGLGLAIAHDLAALLGGRIEVESALHKGSTFRLLLPGREVVLDAAGGAELPVRRREAVVLLIEDDGRARAETAGVLRRSGARVVEAADGFEGLRRARSHRPDMIVLDLGLPGLGGGDVLAHLKRDCALATVPVVVVTGEPSPAVEAECRAAGGAAYLRKPFDPSDLLHALATLTRAGGRTFDTAPAAG